MAIVLQIFHKGAMVCMTIPIRFEVHEILVFYQLVDTFQHLYNINIHACKIETILNTHHQSIKSISMLNAHICYLIIVYKIVARRTQARNVTL